MDQETELRGLMAAYGALAFIQVPSVFEAWSKFNQGLTESIFPPEEIPRPMTIEQVRDAAEIIFAMVLARGDDDELAEAVAKARPEMRVRVTDALEHDKRRLRG